MSENIQRTTRRAWQFHFCSRGLSPEHLISVLSRKKLFHFLTICPRSPGLCLLLNPPVKHLHWFMARLWLCCHGRLWAASSHDNVPPSAIRPLRNLYHYTDILTMIVEKMMRSDIYETLEDLAFLLVIFTSQHIYINVKYAHIAVLPRAPPVALHKTQGRGIFMSGQDQNRKRAMSWTDWGWWVSGLITQTDWISGLKEKDSLCVWFTGFTGRLRRMMFGGDALQVGKPNPAGPHRCPQPVLQTPNTGLK